MNKKDGSKPAKPSHVSRLQDGVEPHAWRYAMATKARVIIDAADYFAVMQAAMLNAKYRILLIGWDFDTRIHLAEGRSWWQKGFRQKYPSRLGSFFVWLTRHRPTLEIKILKWSFGAFKFAIRSSMWMDLARWFPHRRIDFKFDSAHPMGCSHHQKIVILDNSLAVCGGIDMTTRRWDTTEHLENDERRTTSSGKSYPPWHDATMMVEGEVAEALSGLGRDRWIRAGGRPLVPIKPPPQSLWPNGLAVDFENVEIGIARTRAHYREWDAVSEIEQLFLHHIARAERFIYAESQYFASRAIAEAIVARLEEDDPPEFVIVHPANADGWLEQQAMDHTRASLVRVLEAADRHDRFSLWVPYAGEQPIYVHAKIMIVDDLILHIGSANMNNRSLGLDSECDLFIDSTRPANRDCGARIAAIRHELLGEHCGLDAADVRVELDRSGSMIRFIEQRANNLPRHLRRYRPPELKGLVEGLAESSLLDPEDPDDLFEPFAKGGLFRDGSRLQRVKRRLTRKDKR